MPQVDHETFVVPRPVHAANCLRVKSDRKRRWCKRGSPGGRKEMTEPVKKDNGYGSDAGPTVHVTVMSL